MQFNNFITFICQDKQLIIFNRDIAKSITIIILTLNFNNIAQKIQSKNLFKNQSLKYLLFK